MEYDVIQNNAHTKPGPCHHIQLIYLKPGPHTLFLIILTFHCSATANDVFTNSKMTPIIAIA